MSKNTELDPILENIPDIIYFKDGNGKYSRVSDSMNSILDTAKENIQGKSDFDIFPEEIAQEMYEEDIQVINKGKPITGKEKEITTPNGENKWLRVHKFPRYSSEGKIVGTFGLLKDITRFKEMERELKKDKEQAKLMAEKSGNLICRIDREFNCIYANQKAAIFLGRGKEEIIGSKITELLSGELEEKFREKVEEVIETGEGIEMEHKWENPSKWLFSIFTPIPDPESGEIVDIMITSRDITRTKEAEERQEFLHSLMRHDIRNKIQIIQGYLQFLEDTKTSEEQEKYLNKAIKASRKGYDLIEEVRALRKTEKDHKILDVNVGGVAEKVIKENIERTEEKGVKIDFNREDIKVKGGPLLRPMLENLILNGVQHSGGNLVKVRIMNRGEDVKIIVEDNGKGIPEKNKDKIFDRSWSGKDSRGSGLGLHLVKKIAETYGGDVEVKDSEMDGARFDVILEKACENSPG